MHAAVGVAVSAVACMTVINKSKLAWASDILAQQQIADFIVKR